MSKEEDLIVAIIGDDVDKVKELLDLGVNVNRVNPDCINISGIRPLISAKIHCNTIKYSPSMVLPEVVDAR